MINQSHSSDTELLAKYRSTGQEYLLGVLLDRYTLLLFGFCMKYLKDEDLAKDAIQQVFLKAIGELRKYDVTYIKSWLFTIARNYCLMQLRSKSEKFEPLDFQVADESSDFLDTVKKHYKKDELMELMYVALNDLNDQQKQCITLFYLNHKSYNQIAEKEGITLMQVKSAIQNGKRNIRNLLEKAMKKQA